jgi:hypothetical protein
MGRLFVLFILADLVLTLVALIDCLSVEQHEIRALPRFVWALIIVIFSPIGGIAWFVAGRPQRADGRAGIWGPGNGSPDADRPRRELAPDDDPEFLGRLANRGREQNEDRLRAWEADLRRRERELRNKQRPSPEQSSDS